MPRWITIRSRQLSVCFSVLFSFQVNGIVDNRTWLRHDVDVASPSSVQNRRTRRRRGARLSELAILGNDIARIDAYLALSPAEQSATVSTMPDEDAECWIELKAARDCMSIPSTARMESLKQRLRNIRGAMEVALSRAKLCRILQ